MIRRNADQLMPNLWIGDYYDAHNKDFIKRNQINVIVNCTRDLKFPQISGIHKYRVAVHDNLTDSEIARMGRLIPNVVPIIHEHIQAGDRVLVHCAAGMQRSAVVVLSYLYQHQIKDPLVAYEYLVKKRPIVFMPAMNFKKSFCSNYGNELCRYKSGL